MLKNITRFFFHTAFGIFLTIIIGLAVGFFTLKFAAWPIYKVYREARWMTMAQEFHDSSDFVNANLMIRRILMANPTRLEAWNLARSIAEQENDGSLPFIIEQISTLQPERDDLKIELADAFLRAGNPQRSLEILRTVSEEGQDSIPFHEVAYLLSLTAQRLPQADFHLTRLAALLPNDEETTLNLAVVRLRHPEAAFQEAAKNTLIRLSDRPALARQALRALIAHSLEQENRGAALAFKVDFEILPGLEFIDHLLLLRIARELRLNEYPARLQESIRQAGNDLTRIQQLADVLRSVGATGDAIDFLNHLPDDVREQRLIQAKTAEVLFFAERFQELETMLLRQNWDENEFFRFSLLAYSARERGDLRAARDLWRSATLAATNTPVGLSVLMGQATQWGWQEERLDLLQRMFQRNPRDDTAFRELFDLYMGQGSSPDLLRLLNRRMEMDRSDRDVLNKFAFLSLLQGTNLAQAQVLARDVHRAQPANPDYAVTFALSMWRQNRTAEGLEVLENLSPEDRSDPERLLYYGLMLAHGGHPERAIEVLTDPNLRTRLPEEASLRERTLRHARSLL